MRRIGSRPDPSGRLESKVGWDAGADRASNDADVSSVPPKIPYGGFSPVRLQGWHLRRGLPLRRLMTASPGLRPSFVSPATERVARSMSRPSARYGTAIRAANAALPQGPSLRSGLFCPGPSTLMRPHPPHSRARRHFAALRLIGDAFAVPAGLGDPRVVPCFRCPFLPDMPFPTDPGEFVDCTPSAFVNVAGLRRFRTVSALSTFPAPDSAGASISGLPDSLSVFTSSLRPVSLLASLSGPTELPLPTETLTSGLSAGRSPFRSPDMTTAPTGQSALVGLAPTGSSASIAAP